MTKATRDMTKRELADWLANRHYGGTDHLDWARKAYMQDSKDELAEQVEVDRGERTPEQLTYKYDH